LKANIVKAHEILFNIIKGEEKQTDGERCAYTPVTLETPGVNLSLSNYDGL